MKKKRTNVLQCTHKRAYIAMIIHTTLVKRITPVNRTETNVSKTRSKYCKTALLSARSHHNHAAASTAAWFSPIPTSLTFPPLEHLRYALVAPAVWFMVRTSAKQWHKVTDGLEVEAESWEQAMCRSHWVFALPGEPGCRFWFIGFQRTCSAFRGAFNCPNLFPKQRMKSFLTKYSEKKKFTH